MQNSLLVSICIPAYEYPQLLRQCLLSIVNQTYQNFEVIIADDSSHDDLLDVVKEFCDSRIQYYKNDKALGSPANWNKCISYANGDLIKILHHDDWFYSNDSLAEFVAPFKIDLNLKFAFSECINVFQNKEVRYRVGNNLIKKLKKNPTILLFFNAIGAPSTTIFRKNVFDEIKFDENSLWYVDVIFYISVLNKVKDFFYIKNILVNITTQSNTQVTNNTSGFKKVKEEIYAFNKFGIFKQKKLSKLELIRLIESFKRYGITSKKEFEKMNYPSHIIKYLKLPLQISIFPIPYKFYAVLRHIIIRQNLIG